MTTNNELPLKFPTSPGNPPSRSCKTPRTLSLIMAGALVCAASAWAQVGGIAPKILVDPKSPAAAKQITAADNDRGQTTTTLGTDGITVNIAAGPAKYPGISIKSGAGTPWDLTPWGHVEAKITNLGEDKLSVGMQVDNKDDGSSCNSEILDLQPGESKVIKVIFGYSEGFQKAFALDPGSVIQILFIADGIRGTPRSFLIEDLQASGPAGEVPPFDPGTFRLKPKNGAIFGDGAKIDAEKQIVAKAGSKVAIAADGTLQIDFAGGSNDGQVLIRPAVGSWDLTDKFQVQVKLKNTGRSPVSPKVRVESKGGASDTISSAAPIPPGGRGIITVPFSTLIPPVIPDDPKQSVFGTGSWAAQNWGPQDGTGTKFTSDWTKGVTILTDKTGGVKSLAVTSITATVPEPPKLPDWLGRKPPVEGDWIQTLDENFDGNSINLSRWNIYTHNYWDKRTHFSKDNTIVKDGGMEHDILEFLSGWGPFRYNTAFHWDGYGREHKAAGTTSNYVLPDKEGFITAGFYWVPGLAVYYAQGKEILRWESPRVCSVPSYIMFYVVSGGWDNQPLEDAKLPDDFVIDYVRAWQRKDLASPVDGPLPNKGLPSSVSEAAMK